MKTTYQKIVDKRDKYLKDSKEVGDYNFNVAHGLTEAIRCFKFCGNCEEFTHESADGDGCCEKTQTLVNCGDLCKLED